MAAEGGPVKPGCSMRWAMRPAMWLAGVSQDTGAANPLRSVGWKLPGGWHRSGFRDPQMMTAQPTDRTLTAPEALGLDSRVTFRRSASALLDELPEGSGRLVIDLSATKQVDSAGLGALMMIQRKAAERRQTVCLRGPNEELRFLLVLTKLDDLFELEAVTS